MPMQASATDAFSVAIRVKMRSSISGVRTSTGKYLHFRTKKSTGVNLNAKRENVSL